MNVNQVIHCWLAEDIIRVEICRDRHDRRSCKICAICVNFPGKQRDFSHNLRRTRRRRRRFTLTKCDFALKHTWLNSKKIYKINAFTLFLFE